MITKQKPLISVLTSVYNGKPNEIINSIKSIQNQSIQNIEYIIINDGSNSCVKELLNVISKHDNRIRMINNKYNLGLTKSLNKGIKIATADYIARQDADDISLPNRLETQLLYFLENTNCSLLGSNVNFKYGEKIIPINYKVKNKYSYIKEILKYKNIYHHSSMMFKRHDAIEIGMYNEFFKYSQDYDLWLRFSEKYECNHIPNILVTIDDFRQSSISKKHMRQQIGYSILARINAYIRSKRNKSYILPILKSILCRPLAFIWLCKRLNSKSSHEY